MFEYCEPMQVDSNKLYYVISYSTNKLSTIVIYYLVWNLLSYKLSIRSHVYAVQRFESFCANILAESISHHLVI